MTQLLTYTTTMKTLSNIVLSERNQIQKLFHIHKHQTKLDWKLEIRIVMTFSRQKEKKVEVVIGNGSKDTFGLLSICIYWPAWWLLRCSLVIIIWASYLCLVQMIRMYVKLYNKFFLMQEVQVKEKRKYKVILFIIFKTKKINKTPGCHNGT